MCRKLPVHNMNDIYWNQCEADPEGKGEDGPDILEVASGGEAVEFPVAFAYPVFH